AVRDGAKHAFPSGFVSLLTTSLFGPAAKFEAARFLASILKIDTRELMNATLRSWVDENIAHAQVKEFLYTAFRIATYTNAPDLMSAGSAIRQLQLAFSKNVLYLDGGWQTIVDGLRQAALSAGVSIDTGTRVDRMAVDAVGAFYGFQLADGRRINASAGIIAASPRVAAAIAGHRAPSLERLASQAIPVRVSCLDVALRRLPKPRSLYAFGMDRPLYMSVHSFSARLAPDGCALIQLAKYLPPDESGDESAESELESLLSLVQPGWKDELAYRRFLPDMIVTNAIVAPKAAVTRA